MDLDLKGKRALVTGGSKGIGRACAEVLAAEGCEVAIASRNPPACGPFRAKAIDLSQRGAAEALALWAGELDILVNNAGAIPGGDLLKVDEETWRRAWDLKVFGYINLTRQVYAAMKARGGGAIVNIIGSAGEKMNAAYIAGSTGNAGLMAFTRALGGASHVDGIRVVGINPGPVATDRLLTLYQQMAATQLGDAARYPELFKGMSYGRPAKPEEVAWTAAFLASPRSSYTSGCVVTIDGGLANRAP
ncbi:MAG: short-chain dehydrogenase [Betaproteobacteria bacterium RIFCSPLOWO2_02_FULL_67_19]|nr:MAG: short-chain dehydrogenase [Betaproteobacteria bacterium RIFCSPLOWO2_02_FULL_67_19]